MSYKDTLNLPSTAFPMKANLREREPKMLAAWHKQGIYEKICAKAADAEPFIIHDGPPYANGDIHIGHAMNKIRKDMMCKVARLSGYASAFVPGWDCHGLPIEINVEKKVGKAGVKVSPAEFRAACRKYAAKQVDGQRESFKRLGVLADWENPYLTMSYSYEADTVRVLGKLLEGGYIRRGQKPVYWCPACASSLAEAEVEYQDKVSHAVDVAFNVCDIADLSDRIGVTLTKDSVLPIWTTTPWTLPANQAVALHPELDYVLVEVDSGTDLLIIAKELSETVLQRYSLTQKAVLAEFKGDKLAGLLLQHPFLPRQVPVIMGEHVTVDAGTGAVHTAPMHGEDDYKVGLLNNLPMEAILDSRSCFLESVPEVGGMHVFKANEPIVELLEAKGVLLYGTKIEHSYPHCWRHKTPILYRATAQWFVDVDHNNLRSTAISEVENVTWSPSWGEKRIAQMVATRPDWCISRQRTWGAPIAFIMHRQTSELHPQMPALIEKIASLIEDAGVQAWYDLDLADLIDDAADYEKVTDILDVWFDSGVSHYCVLQKREDLKLPAEVYFEGSDQHRGWFQSSLLTSVAVNGKAPFKSVQTHGYVVDANGHKMSKSRGNVTSPQEVINKFGADVLRLWVASSDTRNDMTVSDEILQRMSDAYRRIRNTSRYLLANLGDFSPQTDLLPVDDFLAIDKWLLASTHKLQDSVLTAYAAHDFSAAYHLLHNFCSNELGGFYLDILKDRQYTCQKASQARRSGQSALYYLLQSFVRLLSPILSFTADEIWQFIPGEKGESVFLANWFELPRVDCADVDWEKLIALRDAVNMQLEQARSNGEIGGALDAKVIINVDSAHADLLAQVQAELRFLLLTSSVVVNNSEQAALSIEIVATSADKCTRCWQRRDDVGEDADHPELCSRCISNVDGAGEKRRYF
jgi:isoleucyl-tRNA synthetase